MRALSFFVYDPTAQSDSPDSRSSLNSIICRFCELHHHTIHHTIALSAHETNPTDAKNQLLRFLREQQQPFVVVVPYSRQLGSTPQESVETVLTIDAQGSQVITAGENQRDPIQNLYQTLTFVGQGATPTHSQRVRSAMIKKAIRGEGLGKPPYGYRVSQDGTLQEVPDEAQVVRLIYDLYVEQRAGLRSIAHQLNTDGYRTKRGGNWNIVSVRAILRNSAYIGTYRRFGLRIPRNHISIIESGTYRKVQDIMESYSQHRRGNQQQPYLLSGLATCAECGNKMIGVTRRQAWSNKNGQRMRNTYRYYLCQSRANQSLCQYHSWRASELEQVVVAKLRIAIGKEIDRQDRLHSDDVAQPAQNHLRANQERRYMTYLKQAAEGSIPLRRLRVLLDSLNSGRDRNGWVRSVVKPNNSSDQTVMTDPKSWSLLNEEAKRHILAQWIKTIQVTDTDIEITLKETSGR